MPFVATAVATDDQRAQSRKQTDRPENKGQTGSHKFRPILQPAVDVQVFLDAVFICDLRSLDKDRQAVRRCWRSCGVCDMITKCNTTSWVKHATYQCKI